MKKYLFLLASSVVLSGCSLLPQQNQDAMVPAAEQNAMTKEFEKVAMALQSGSGVECIFTRDTDGSTMTFQMLGNKTRASGQLNPDMPETSSMINDSENLYTWQDSTMQGTKMSLAKLNEATGEAEENEAMIPDFTPEDEAKYESMGYSIKCDEKSLTDADFMPPTDVKFTDISSMMQKTPAMSEDDVKGLMEQFGQ